MTGENYKKEFEERLALLSSELIRSYKDLIMDGPLSAYFAVVEKGYLDAAQHLTPQVKESIARFQDKITEIVSDSDYTASALYLLEDMEEAIKIFDALSKKICPKKAPTPTPSEEAKETPAPEPSTDDAGGSGSPQ